MLNELLLSGIEFYITDHQNQNSLKFLPLYTVLTHGAVVAEPLPVWFYNFRNRKINNDQHYDKPSDHTVRTLHFKCSLEN